MKKELDNIKCDNCGYCNHRKYVEYSGICHGCGKILDSKVKFKLEMIKRLQLWRGKRVNRYEWFEIQK